MSHQTETSSTQWERIKNMVHSLYNIKKLPLEGSNGVMETMRLNHGFEATKAQYEKYFKEWGFRKYRKTDDWKTLEQKLQIRKRKGKESEVYEDGKLIPSKRLRKELSRHGFLTVEEQFRTYQDSPPQTPPGLKIRTPAGQPFVHLSFWNLPILGFQESIKNFTETIDMPNQTALSLGPLFGRNPNMRGGGRDRGLSQIDAFLPTAALLEEPTGSTLAIIQADDLCKPVFLGLVTFILSNNLPGETSGKNLYKLLKNLEATNLLRIITSMEGPTVKAVLENVFRLAVENEDLPIVKQLLQAGVNPNGHKCKHERIIDTMSPLQYALVTGNSDMAHELIKHGSTIDHRGNGWKSSALVLAITGWDFDNYWRGRPDDWYHDPSLDYFSMDGNQEDSSGSEDGNQEVNSGNYSQHGNRQANSEYYSEHGDQRNNNSQLEGEIQGNSNDNRKDAKRLFELVLSLIDAGADVDPNYNDLSGGDNFEQYDHQTICPMLLDGHSPLTAASRYRHPEIVDLLISKRADTSFLTYRKTSALHECLYSWNDMEAGVVFFESNIPNTNPRLLFLRDRPPRFRGEEEKSRIKRVVSSLLVAGADPSKSLRYDLAEKYEWEFADEDDCGSDFNYSSEFSALELAIYTESVDVLKVLLNHGAEVTERALEIAIESNVAELLLCLLEEENVMSAELWRIAARAPPATSSFWTIVLERTSEDFYFRKAAMMGAIRGGDVFVMDIALRSETSDSPPLLEASQVLTTTMERCCQDGRPTADILERLLSPDFKYRSAVLPALRSSLNGEILRACPSVVELLLASGEANVLPANVYQTAFSSAVREKNTPLVWKLLEIVETPHIALPLNGCSHISTHDTLTGTMLVAALAHAEEPVATFLLDSGVDINAPGSADSPKKEQCSCRTPLTAAILAGQSTLLWRLLADGAKVNNPPRLKQCISPLAAATYRRDIPLMVDLLAQGANPEDALALEFAALEHRLLSPLLDAMKGRKSDKGCNVGFRAIIRAIVGGDRKAVKEILSRELINFRSLEPDPGHKLRDTADRIIFRSSASSYRDGPICSVLFHALWRSVDPEITKLILNSGADPNRIVYKGYFGPESALLAAIHYGNTRRVKLLLEAGAKADPPFALGMDRSALQLAVQEKKKGIVRILLEHGADPNAASPLKYSRRPIQIAVYMALSDIVLALLKHKADPDALTEDSPHTALQIAAEKGFIEISRILLEYGANVNAPPAKNSGATALQFAAIGGFLGIAHMLLEYGADVNATPAEVDGRTALEGAAEHGRTDMVQLLLNHGADIHSGQYERAVEFAEGNGHHALKDLLESYKNS